jgi:hypothetical protein
MLGRMVTYAPRRTAGSLADLAAEQCGVVGRAQLFALGVNRDAIRTRARAGRWRLVGSSVVVVHSGPLTDRARQWAAVLAAGPDAALCGLTAAAAGGLSGFPTRVIHVVVANGAHPPRPPDEVAPVKVHVSRRFDFRVDVHPSALPPRTRTARAVIDASTWADSDVRGCGVMAAAVQQRLVTVDHLRDELATAGSVRRRRLLEGVLGDIEGGAHSFAELDLARIFREVGLPPPVRQAIREDPSGRRRYLDAFWPDHGLCVEIDGSFHWTEQQWRLDIDRHNHLVADGIRLLRIPALLLRADRARVLEPIARILRPASC